MLQEIESKRAKYNQIIEAVGDFNIESEVISDLDWDFTQVVRCSNLSEVFKNRRLNQPITPFERLMRGEKIVMGVA